MKKRVIITAIILIMLVITNINHAGNIQFLNLKRDSNVLTTNDYRIVGYTNILKKNDYQEYQNMIYLVQKGDSLYLIARKFNTSVVKLKAVNNLKADMIYVGQKLYIPGTDTGTPPDSSEDNRQTYLVQRGDSLYLIARKFNTSIAKIKAVNNLKSDIIYVGQKLYIPGTGSSENNNPDKDPYSEEGIVYFVRPGDSLYYISLQFKTTVEKIKEINKLGSNALYVDQMLYITPQTTDSNHLVYFVQIGDTLNGIADKFNTSVIELKLMNDLHSDNIRSGQKLYIKFPVINKNINFILNYRVEAGNNIDVIARRFNLSVWDIRLYNKLTTDLLQTGQLLQIPLIVPDEELINGMDVTEEEIDLLARAVFSEARGEPFAGQVAVAGVILNRIRSELFPDTIEDVIFQPWQFTAVHDGQFWLEPDQIAYLAARAALKGWDPSRGSIFYYNPNMAVDDWIFYRDVVVEIGDHYFAVSI